MKFFSEAVRLLHIRFILQKHGLDEIAFKTSSLKPLRYLIRLFPLQWIKRHQKPRAVRIREALEELGPIFVKFGQLLSTRLDMLPEDIVKELALLQDKVPPFSGEIAKKMIEDALKNPISDFFQTFEVQALASASIAQVHAATLLNGESVVIKVLRPKARKMIQRDIALLKTLATLVDRYWKASRRFKPREMVTEFERTLLDELDLTREAANASQLKRNFKDSALLYVPTIHWPLTQNNILVMERMYGTPISNVESLKSQGFDLDHLAKQLIEVFFTQAFRDCFFHADLHPGNIWVAKAKKQNQRLSVQHPHSTSQLIAIDFGIMGSLSPTDQKYLASNFLAFLNRDYRQVARLHLESGWIPTSIRLDEFEAAIRAVSEPMFEQPIHTFSFARLLYQLIQTAVRYQINIQPQLVLLQKTLVNLEGICRQLSPTVDLWSSSKPFLEEWMRSQIGLPSLIRKIKINTPDWVEKLPELPLLAYNTLTQYVQQYTMQSMNPVAAPAYSSNLPRYKQTALYLKDICIGILLGISLCLVAYIWISR